MRDYFKTKTWLITVLMFLIAFGLSSVMVFYEFGSKKNIKTTSASADNNVSGWAWNSNTGWVSFNCTNDTPACNGTNYGVSININTGHFSGYAWSSNTGWVSFNEVGAPDYAFNTSCAMAGSCAEANTCTACYNWSDHKVRGWAKILSLGANGWIKFDGAWTNTVTIDPATDSFSGWAWNANNDGSGIGWVSFNCANDSSCGASNYKVIGKINRPPSVSNMTAPNWNFSNAGRYGALKTNLNWQFNDPDGNPESAYQIKINTSNNSDNPIFDSGVCTAYNTPTDKCKVDADVGQFPLHLAMSLNYNTAYYWWIMVWDNALNSLPSSLTQYNTSPDTDNNDGAALTFTTYKHEMPIVDFIWFPLNPSKGEEAKFTDTSQVYLSSAPSTAIPCDSVNCRWQWSATVNADITSPTASTTIIKFNSAGNATVTLKVTDLDNYYISTSKAVIVNANLPKWKEVKPE